jgi:hypothetical protein
MLSNAKCTVAHAEERRSFPRAIFHGEKQRVCSKNQSMRGGLIALTYIYFLRRAGGMERNPTLWL